MCLPLPLIVRGHVVPQPDNVVQARPTGSFREILINWQGGSLADATWEPLEQFKEEYLELKV
jgi:hypothetical protein